MKKILSLLFVFLICGALGFETDAYASKLPSQDATSQKEYKSEVLKALGAKGMVKSINFEGGWSFEFTPDGQPVKEVTVEDGNLILGEYDEESAASFTITINNGKLKQLAREARFFGEVFDFTGYEDGLPVRGTTNWGDTKIDVLYPESDSNGNWTVMVITSPDRNYPMIETREIVYWPEGTTMADYEVPTSIPQPTEEELVTLIRRVGRRNPVEIFTKDFNQLLSEYLERTHNTGVGGGKNNFFEWPPLYPSEVEISEQRNITNREGNEKTFVFSYQGKYPGGKTLDRKDGTAYLKFEDGKWKIDDLVIDVEYITGKWAHNTDSWRLRMLPDDRKDEYGKVDSKGYTELTESAMKNLIKKANRMDRDVLTRDFNQFLDRLRDMPYIGYRDQNSEKEEFLMGVVGESLLKDETSETHEPYDIPDIVVNLFCVQNAGNNATVVFHYSGIDKWKSINDYNQDLLDPDHVACVELKFEDGKWLVDDFGKEVMYKDGVYWADWHYKDANKDLWGNGVEGIRNGELEREIRTSFSNDINKDVYLQRVADYKKKYIDAPNIPKANTSNEQPQDSNEDEEIFVAVDQPAEFPGGMAALMGWLSHNMRYPETAQRDGTQGKVIVKFVIAKDGRVMNPEIEKSVREDLDNEALRLAGKMPVWQPAKNDGIPVASYYVMPFNFRLRQE